jgi:peptidoglycan/LPS O-acetylase OafA/YrhL
MKESTELPLIQAYRALAVTLVVLLHGSITVNDRCGEMPLNDFFRFGFSGVLLFFVISGFIICYAHQNDMGSGRVFYYLLRRAARIYPFYWFVFLFIGAWRWYSGVIDLPDLLSNAFLFEAQKTWVIPVSWTMHWEVAFYLVFSSFILNKALGVCTLIFWVLGYTVVPHDTGWAILDPISSLFILGLLAAFLVISLQRRSARLRNRLGVLSFLVGIGLFLFAIKNFFLAGSPDSWPSDWPILMGFGMSSFFLVLASISPALNAMAAQSKCISWIGNASYSIYLTHVQFERATVGLTKFLSSAIGGKIHLSSGAMLLICVSIATLGGIFLHKSVEEPILNTLRSRINRWRIPRNHIKTNNQKS